MYQKNVVFGIGSLLFSLLCFSNCTSTTKIVGNPASPGFDLEGSDSKAIAIADEVMAAMGGRQAWENTRYLHWNFFGSRSLSWDKWKGKVRIESHKDDFKAIVYLHDKSKGQIEKGGLQISQPDSLEHYLEKAKSIWINDSYWLVMPFKLKDSGVTLKYLGEKNTKEGRKSDVLSLTFKNVGKTPQNKYEVYVDKESRLITQWDFYTKHTDEEARFSTPWANYKSFGKILLSGDRGGDYQLTDISIKELSDRLFEEL